MCQAFQFVNMIRREIDEERQRRNGKNRMCRAFQIVNMMKRESDEER